MVSVSGGAPDVDETGCGCRTISKVSDFTVSYRNHSIR